MMDLHSAPKVNAFTFELALSLFQHTLKTPGLRGRTVGPDIAAGLLSLADEAVVNSVSQMAADALAAGRRVWITSDFHFNHESTLSFCKRPFPDVATMNAALRRLLLKVGQDDLLIFAGDLKMGKDLNPPEMQGLPGRKILVTGNHDFTYSGKPRFDLFLEPDGRPIFEHVVPFLYWKDGQGPAAHQVVVSHFPLEVPPGYDLAQHGLIRNYHGHLHDEFKESTEQVKYVNVCWDSNNAMCCL